MKPGTYTLTPENQMTQDARILINKRQEVDRKKSALEEQRSALHVFAIFFERKRFELINSTTDEAAKKRLRDYLGERGTLYGDKDLNYEIILKNLKKFRVDSSELQTFISNFKKGAKEDKNKFATMISLAQAIASNIYGATLSITTLESELSQLEKDLSKLESEGISIVDTTTGISAREIVGSKYCHQQDAIFVGHLGNSDAANDPTSFYKSAVAKIAAEGKDFDSGTTFCSAIVKKKKGQEDLEITTANLGDSRASIIVAYEKNGKKAYQSISLTQDHTPGAVARIDQVIDKEKRDGKSRIKNGRVLSADPSVPDGDHVGLSAGIGDVKYSLYSAPDVVTYDLDWISKQLSTAGINRSQILEADLVVCCDGVYDVMDDDLELIIDSNNHSLRNCKTEPRKTGTFRPTLSEFKAEFDKTPGGQKFAEALIEKARKTKMPSGKDNGDNISAIHIPLIREKRVKIGDKPIIATVCDGHGAGDEAETIAFMLPRGADGKLTSTAYKNANGAAVSNFVAANLYHLAQVEPILEIDPHHQGLLAREIGELRKIASLSSTPPITPPPPPPPPVVTKTSTKLEQTFAIIKAAGTNPIEEIDLSGETLSPKDLSDLGIAIQIYGRVKAVNLSGIKHSNPSEQFTAYDFFDLVNNTKTITTINLHGISFKEADFKATLEGYTSRRERDGYPISIEYAPQPKIPVPTPTTPSSGGRTPLVPATAAAVPQIINYEIDETAQTIKINSITPEITSGLSEADYQNLYDIEFAPIIEFYKNRGTVEFEGSIKADDHSGLGRFTPDHQNTTPTDRTPFATLKASLLEIAREKQDRGANYFEDISELETDEKGRISQASFFRHARKHPDLPELNNGDVEGRHWYGSRSIELVNKAYVIKAGFSRTSDQLGTPMKYEKDGNLIFLGGENGGRIDDIFEKVSNSLEAGKKAQIFIPINRSNVHWSTLEVEVTKGNDGKFSIQNLYFDPSGAATAITEIDNRIVESARRNFGAQLEKFSSQGFDTKRQRDGSSCGPISCWYVGQRALNLSCGNSGESFEPGALDLRLEQIRCISREVGVESAQITQRSYDKPRDLTLVSASKAKKTVASPPKTKLPDAITKAQSKCEDILMSLNGVKDSEFSFFHSSIREIFVAELEKFHGASKFPAAKNEAELFRNAQRTIESEFLLGEDDIKFLKFVVIFFEQNPSKALEVLSNRYKKDLLPSVPPAAPTKTFPAEEIFLTTALGTTIKIEAAASNKLGSVLQTIYPEKASKEERKALFSDLKELAIRGLSSKALTALELDEKGREKVTTVEHIDFNSKTKKTSGNPETLEVKFGERYVRREFNDIIFTDSPDFAKKFGNNSFANCTFNNCNLEAIAGKTIKFANCTFDKDCKLPFDLKTLEKIGFSGCKFSENLVQTLSQEIKDKIGIEGVAKDGFYSTTKAQYIPKSDLEKAKKDGTAPAKPSTIPFTSGLNAQLRTASGRTV